MPTAELARAGVMYPGSGFMVGPEAVFPVHVNSDGITGTSFFQRLGALRLFFLLRPVRIFPGMLADGFQLGIRALRLNHARSWGIFFSGSPKSSWGMIAFDSDPLTCLPWPQELRRLSGTDSLVLCSSGFRMPESSR